MPLLDVASGFFVWAAHLLTIYIGTAVCCVLGLGEASARSRSIFLMSLVLVTLAATAVVIVHALRRHRLYRTLPALGFRMSVTVGCDAIAAVAIVWQFFPLVLVPACA